MISLIFLLFTLLLLFPFQILRDAPGAFNFTPLLTFSILLVIFFSFLFLIFLLKRKLVLLNKYHQILCAISAFCFAGIIRDSIFSIKNIQLELTELKSKEMSFLNSISEIMLFLLCFFGFIYVQKKFKSQWDQFLKIFMIINIVIFTEWCFAQLSLDRKRIDDLDFFSDNTDNQEEGPIIHIILDRLDAKDGLKLIADDSDLQNLLAGFEFFPFTFVNYNWTEPSISSLFLGNLLDKSFNQKNGILNIKNKTLAQKLAEKGYRNFLIRDMDKKWYGHGWNKDVEVSSLSDNNKSYSLDYQRTLVLHLLDFSTLKLLPSVLRVYDEEEGRGIFGKLTNNISWKNTLKTRIIKTLPSFDWFVSQIENLTNNKHYIFFHSFLTHTPFIFNKNCNIDSLTQMNFDKKSMKDEHLLCAKKKIKDFLRKLRSIDFYNRIKIIIHSDHGHNNKKSRAFFLYKDRFSKNKLQVNFSVERINNIHYYILDQKKIVPTYNLVENRDDKIYFFEVSSHFLKRDIYRYDTLYEKIYSNDYVNDIKEMINKIR